MTNILTVEEAANVLRTDPDDPAMLDLLASVDRYIQDATGRDWTGDPSIHPGAKAAARILLTLWYDYPGMVSDGQQGNLPGGLRATLSQLEALALRYKTFEGRGGAGAIALAGARRGDIVEALTGLVGSSGDQSAKFESVITVDDQIQQVSGDDLAGTFYRALLTPLDVL